MCFSKPSNLLAIQTHRAYLIIISCLFILQMTLSSINCIAADVSLTKKFKSAVSEANKGSPKAMFLLARMLERGIGTPINIKEASKWYQRSASQNYPAANARLGKLYLEGIGVKRNLKKSFNLLQLASVQGIPSAQFNLAIIYELGVGTKKDIEQAIKWYDRATQGGYYTAKNKSDQLKKQLGIKIKSNTNQTINITQTKKTKPKNTTQQGIGDIAKSDKTPTKTVTNTKKAKPVTVITKQIFGPAKFRNKASPQKSESVAKNPITNNQNEFKVNTLPISINQLSKKQKLELIKNTPLRNTLKNLIEGRWFDKNKPVNFLPSPKTQCNIINLADLKCTSRQLQRQTSNETIYYKTITILSKLLSTGTFNLKYQNTILRVVIDNELTAKGEPFESNIKKGSQQKTHNLKCQFNKAITINCSNNEAEEFAFTNRANIQKIEN